MGVFESTVHFDNLTAVIDNHSSYEIKFRVSRPENQTHDQSTQTYENQKLLSEEQSLNHQTQYYVYAGLVMPYSTKYFEFRDVEKEYRFSVYALKHTQEKKQSEVSLQKNIKILSQSTVCIRVTSDLKVIHLTAEQIESLKLRKQVEMIFLKQSSIVRNQELSHRILGFFDICPFKAKLLFKASEHHFDMKKFYHKFGLMESVLLLSKTSNNKIIGGYSRQSLISPEQGNADQNGWRKIRDETNSSFIFSVSSNDIFRLKAGQTALFYNNNNEQICFGSDELRINNHSDKNPCLSQNFNTNYENHNYNNDTESYKLFNGCESAEFTTKEWEAWVLDFEEEEEIQEDSALLALALDI